MTTSENKFNVLVFHSPITTHENSGRIKKVLAQLTMSHQATIGSGMSFEEAKKTADGEREAIAKSRKRGTYVVEVSTLEYQESFYWD